MENVYLNRFGEKLYNLLLSVPVRIKITGIVLLPVLILGFSLNFWITEGLSDWLSYLLTDVRVQAAMQAGGRSVMVVTILAAAGSLILASLLAFLLTRPLLALHEMAHQVAAGNLDARAPVWSNDEIGDVAAAINSMTDHLVATQNDLARSHRHLDALNRVMLAAEKEDNIHDVLYAVLESSITVMNLQTGWIYLRDPERDVYHLASWYGVPDSLEPHLLRQEARLSCHCQAALVANELPQAASLQPCERLQDCHAVEIQDRHVTIPIQARDQNFGVMNLLCPPEHPLSADEFSLLSDIGAQISEIVANAWLRLKLAEKELSRQALLESLVEAQEEERGRLARELHDESGQMLTTLLVRIKTLERKTDSAEIHEGLAAMQDVVAQTIEQLRELSHRLRPAALEEFGLAVALEALLDDIPEETGLQASGHFDLQGVALPPGVEVTLYRIAQECLTNVMRHAGASTVTIDLERAGDAVFMSVVDDGIGFKPMQTANTNGQRHLGIVSMYERATIAGGQLEVYSAPGQGTAVHVTVPILMSVADAV